ncbi:NAD-dependent epimerase/dehydratase family protein [Novosphingobium sp. JCM 18896]|uniref:NAD-dependent epimerase/dehydratase family protein n=1 Tax=Novosphingobium sp. JCM 18896 TaxID=2989731 RepID=UPI002222D044|nr:NAD(P)-dependent oxidoreductase [Novosphingobium sp. JCM 18896]MCW1429338.1 NAD(P)-dependent oxidoreductase [Novosphingobium sp. JCM 18896]
MTAFPATARFVLTGPSGWIGQAMLDALARVLGGQLDGRVTAFASQARTMELPWGESLAVRALDAITPDDVADAHVIHLAYLTKEKADLLGDDAFDAANDAIDEALLAALRGAPAASLFVASSGAAALAERGDRHAYGMAKLRQEARFLDWAKAAGIPVIAGRIFNIAGPHINKLRSYAISDFALQAQEAGAIRIQAGVPVFRSYLHVEDLCALVLEAARRGIGRGTAIDLCGTEIVEMDDIAALVAAASQGSITIERGPVNFGQPSLYLGDATQTKVLAMELGIELRPLSVQVADTLTWLWGVTVPSKITLVKMAQ